VEVYGLIAGVLTICIGILALNEYAGADKLVWHWLAVLMFRGFVFKRGADKLLMPLIGFAIMKRVLRVREIFGKPEYGRYLCGFHSKT